MVLGISMNRAACAAVALTVLQITGLSVSNMRELLPLKMLTYQGLSVVVAIRCANNLRDKFSGGRPFSIQVEIAYRVDMKLG